MFILLRKFFFFFYHWQHPLSFILTTTTTSLFLNSFIFLSMGFGEENQANNLSFCFVLLFSCMSGCLLLYSSPCVSTCEVLGDYIGFSFVCCSDQRFLGQRPHYLSGLVSVIKNRCGQALTLPTTSVCVKWKAGLCLLWGLALPLNSLVLENFPKYWQGSGFVADP